MEQFLDSTGLTSSESSYKPMIMAFGIVVAISLTYVAYVWYMGRNTVPVPKYITGFQNPLPELPSDTKPSSTEVLASTDKFFNNPPGTKEKPTNTNYVPTGAGPTGHDPNVTQISQVTMDPAAQVKKAEGFFGGAARGTGSPDCMRLSAEGAQLVSMFIERAPPNAEGSDDDLRELTQIVGKLSCFKKDLMSPSYIVEATRYQQFVTMHDIEPIAETTGRCFAKTISPRDLEIAFDKWTSRGETLVRRLCAHYKCGEEDVNRAEELFQAFIRDVKDISRSSCLSGEPLIAGKPGPRDPHPFEDPDLKDLGEYTGYY
jgi:hypothetical protein